MDRPHANLKDLTGRQFSRLTVIERAPKEKGVAPKWVCSCSCGNVKVVHGSNLTSGKQVSCGCVRTEQTRKRMTTHKMTGTPIYAVWNAMNMRCHNPKSASYPGYGGRGIKVCPEWRKFEQFYADMGAAPEGMSIDRIDVNGNYEPGNCRWATDNEQMRNTRTNRFITFNGETKTLVEWSESTGLSYHTLKARFNAGWSPERALTEPIGSNDGRFKAGQPSLRWNQSASAQK